jgi:hypothetical protein
MAINTPSQSIRNADHMSRKRNRWIRVRNLARILGLNIAFAGTQIGKYENDMAGVQDKVYQEQESSVGATAYH